MKMKKIFGLLGNILVLGIAILVLAYIFISLPKRLQRTTAFPSSPSSQANAYPAPETTVHRRTTAFPSSPSSQANAYPLPETTVQSWPTLEITNEPVLVTPTWQPTINPTPITPVPPPDDWPTDLPWPLSTPTNAPPQPTPGVTPYPTPNFTFLDDGFPETDLQSLWYPANPGLHAQLSLDQVLLDPTGKRKQKNNKTYDLGLETYPAVSQLSGFNRSPNGSLAAMAISAGEGGVIEIRDLSSGNLITFDEQKVYITYFYSWSLDEKSFLAKDVNDSISEVSLVDTATGDYQKIVFPERDEIPAEIDDMKFSMDGKSIADAVSYQPWSGKNNPWITEIGIRNSKDPKHRQVLCTIEKGRRLFSHSLKWSFDDQKLLWIGGVDTPDVDGWVLWLWVADIKEKRCQKLVPVGISHSEGPFIPGGFSADWSPTRNLIVYRFGDGNGNTGHSLVLYDLDTSTQKRILEPTDEVISNVHFSPDGNFISYSLLKEDHGEIWITDLEGKNRFPIAGPTSSNASYKWGKNK